ncbi:unnamed protein product, partial [Rotaria magnacalcarata]
AASFAQERIFLDEQVRFTNNIAAYNELTVLRLTNGAISIDRLRRVIRLILEKHSILRTSLTFNSNGGLLMQNITNDHETFTFTIDQTFTSDENLYSILHQTVINPKLFDLASGNVFQCHILRVKSTNKLTDSDSINAGDVLAFAFHHASIDRISTDIFLNDLRIVYNSSESLLLQNDALQYIDYSIHERQLDMTDSRQFWRSQLDGYNLEHGLALPMDRSRRSQSDRSGLTSVAEFSFDDELSHSFFVYASSCQVTPFQLGLATFYTFLFKLTNGQTDLCVACLNANRYRAELQDLVGMFVATLPYRLQIDPNASFRELVQQVREQCSSILEHSHYPLQHILADCHHQQSSTISILEIVFDFITVTPGGDRLNLNGAQLERIPWERTEHVAKFDFMCTFVYNESDVNNPMSCSLICSKDLFDETSVFTIGNRFLSLIRQLFLYESTTTMEQPLHKFSIILSNERVLMNQLNTNLENNKQLTNTSIGEMFCRRAENESQKIAVELDEQSLTYSELLYYVEKVSFHISNKYNIRRGDIICQCFERSLVMVISVMSIEMIGAVYCPLSPRDPPHRLQSLLLQTKSRLVLVHDLTQNKFHGNSNTLDIGSVLCSDSIQKPMTTDQMFWVTATHNDIAYIIFTSGSTGTPKAAQVRHRNFIACIHSLLEVGIFGEKDKVIQMARCSFDIHVQEVIGTLIVGATLVMLHPYGTLDPVYLAKVLREKDVTYMIAVPTLINSLFHYLTETDSSSAVESLRSLCSIGEAISAKLVRLIKSQISNKCVIWNLYGPAEITIACTFHLVDVIMDQTSIPIGQPLPYYRCLVLDEFLQSTIVNQEGELLVGGVGVFAGYLGRHDLTNASLIDIDGCTYYRTGDLVRMDVNGRLHYVGRKDHQIKLRGQRIELGEIEICLLDAAISACIVIKWEEHLIAYIQSASINEKELHEHCRLRLPPFMIPSMFIVLDQLPMNMNGKIDRKSLPIPDFSILYNDNSTDLLPLTPLEERLRCIFAQVFHIESPDVNQPFGHMGGTSLDVMQVLTLIRQQICENFHIGLLLDNPSVRQLALTIEPLLAKQEHISSIQTEMQLDDNQHRPMPSLVVETLGVLVLALQWLCPVWIIYRSEYQLAFLFLPIIHLLTYATCRRVIIRSNDRIKKHDALYSWEYYLWWFLDRLWSINNSYWLKYLVGTPFYNSYLRLCGAHIGLHAHIYTIDIDTPWMLEVGESTFIGNGTILSSLTYHDQTYTLESIYIGAYCSIDRHCVLYGGITVQNNVHAKPMSAMTNCISVSNLDHPVNNRSFTWGQIIYQLVCSLCILFIHCILFKLANIIYQCCSYCHLSLFIALALSWLFWTLISLFIALILLKYIVGCVTPGHYTLNSYYYLNKVWLRQLIVFSFYWSFKWIPYYGTISVAILRWLGAQIGDDVKLADFRPFLYFPSNLLTIEHGVTTFAGAVFAQFEITPDHDCYLDHICVGSATTLGNGCTIMPGTRLPSNTMVGNFTLITRDINGNNPGGVLLGIPSRQMPFELSSSVQLKNDLSSYDSSYICDFLRTCTFFLISKCFLTAVYLLPPSIIAPFIHMVFFCSIYRYSTFHERSVATFSYSDTINPIQQLCAMLMNDFKMFTGPLLARTQLLVILFRAMGARIASDVILFDIDCLTDPQLVTIGDHVRFNVEASVQCHTFERRLLKLAPVTINHSCVLMSYSMILPGSRLHGQNHLLPYTLVMKNDQLPFNTHWSGVPAQRSM